MKKDCVRLSSNEKERVASPLSHEKERVASPLSPFIPYIPFIPLCWSKESAGMVLRLMYFGTVIVLLSIGLPAMAGQMAQKTNDEFFRFCEYGSADFELVKAEFNQRFPIGSEAGELIEAVGKSTGYVVRWDHMPWPPPESGIDLAYYVDAYAYACSLDQGNKNYWSVIFTTDLGGKIARSEFQLFFVDENFKARGIPFRFENFISPPDAKKALRSLTGQGTTRDAVARLMRDAGVKKLNVTSSPNDDQYRKYPDKTSIWYQLGLGDVWVLHWEFGEGGRLQNLR